MRTFDWVWLTTDAQTSALIESYRNASLATKLLGTFDFPKGTAHIRGWLTPWMRIPLVFLAQGELTVGDRRIEFKPRHHSLFGWRMKDVRDDLAFDYTATELVAVESADFSSPVMRFFDLPFTRIRTRHAPPLDNFLVCAGGRLMVPRIRAQSLELRQELLALVR
jgi:hypothetical protein